METGLPRSARRRFPARRDIERLAFRLERGPPTAKRRWRNRVESPAARQAGPTRSTGPPSLGFQSRATFARSLEKASGSYHGPQRVEISLPNSLVETGELLFHCTMSGSGPATPNRERENRN